MALLEINKKIVTLGHSASGKSCYMQVAISYLWRYDSEFSLSSEDTNLDKVTDATQGILKKGKWPDKTSGAKKYHFDLTTRTPRWLDLLWAPRWLDLLKRTHTLIDWTGEAFTAAGLERAGRQDEAEKRWSKCAPDTKEDFVRDCGEADGFLLFLDGERLLQDDEELDSTRECLYWLKDLIMANKKERLFSIIVTKSDYLEGTPEFGTEDLKKVYEKKIHDYIRDKYNSFFKTLESNRYSYLVAPVTCLPVPEHREENAKGTFANEDWKLEDMQKSNIADSQDDMIEPIRWLIKKL